MYRILVVDDEQEMALSIGEMLREPLADMAEVSVLVSGRSARDELSGNSIDILLTDIQMPGINGFDLLHHIQEKELKTRVIFLTGHQRFDYAYEAVKSPGTRFIIKMEREELIIGCVREVLRELDAARQNIELLSRVRELASERYDEAPALQPMDTVEKVKEYICSHSGDEITVATIASCLHFHPAYLSRVFRDVTGKKLSSFILEKKMTDAKDSLRSSGCSVADISRALGYQSPQAFGRVFKKELGITPNEYRRRYGASQ